MSRKYSYVVELKNDFIRETGVYLVTKRSRRHHYYVDVLALSMPWSIHMWWCIG